MTDASSDSDESAGRVQEWEVVSLSTLSMSGSASMCACEACSSGDGERSGDGEGAEDGNIMMSDEFGLESKGIPMLDQFLGSESESRGGLDVEDGNDASGGVEVGDGDGEDREREEAGIVEMGPVVPEEVGDGQEEGSGEQNFLELDWIEPTTPKHEDDRERGVESKEMRMGNAEEVGEGKEERTGEQNFPELDWIEPAPPKRKFTGLDWIEPTPLDADSIALLQDGGCEDHACETWWKRRAALWYMQARQANTLWSLAFAAAVMGLVIIGQRWQHERCQNQHLRLQLCSKDEKISQLIFQVARLKDALSGRRRVPVLRTNSSYTTFRERF